MPAKIHYNQKIATELTLIQLKEPPVLPFVLFVDQQNSKNASYFCVDILIRKSVTKTINFKRVLFENTMECLI